MILVCDFSKNHPQVNIPGLNANDKMDFPNSVNLDTYLRYPSEFCRDKENKDVFRLLMCSNCVSCENKHTVFRTRDVNSAVNIRHITRCWVDKQFRSPVFQISSFTTSNKKEVEKVRPS
jgi:hypothetical protein